MIKAECLHSIEISGASPHEVLLYSKFFKIILIFFFYFEGPCFGCVGVNGGSESLDQLHVSEKEVLWYEGLDPDTRTIKKAFTTETQVLQAFWCRFRGSADGAKDESRKKECGAVCIVEQKCLGVHMDTGAIHYVPFPFPVSEVFLCSRWLPPPSPSPSPPSLPPPLPLSSSSHFSLSSNQ